MISNEINAFKILFDNLNQSFKRKLNITIGAWRFISKQGFNEIKRLLLLYTPYHISTCCKLVHLEKVWNVFDPHGEIEMSKLFIQAHIVEDSAPFFFTLWLENGKTWETSNFPSFIHVLSDNGTSSNVWNKQNSRILFCGYNVNFIPGVLSIAANENFLLYCTLIKVNVRGH